ncbi:hypothetical protein [Streptomyces sp. SID161]|uniref:hypothetical protein n=1 Tax=Streptomyces sp. SID161 TaxID=2690251 RepID=UPI0013F77C7E|nr:hypothetical protein [Streptomyces sp. SID161]MYW45119.1 hypothetical protein [Streptomyces sp. SID161]
MPSAPVSGGATADRVTGVLGTRNQIGEKAHVAPSPAGLAVGSGRCLLGLGDTDRALTLIAEGQALLPPGRSRTRGTFLAYRARPIPQRTVSGPEASSTQPFGPLMLASRCLIQEIGFTH